MINLNKLFKTDSTSEFLVPENFYLQKILIIGKLEFLKYILLFQ